MRIEVASHIGIGNGVGVVVGWVGISVMVGVGKVVGKWISNAVGKCIGVRVGVVNEVSWHVGVSEESEEQRLDLFRYLGVERDLGIRCGVEVT